MAQDVASSAALRRLEGRPISIEPAAIESEFARIWEESDTGGDASSVLLRVVNFVGVGPETWTVERFDQVMESLPQRHPCRGILAVVSPDQTGVEATISARCWLAAGGGKQVCSEEVILRAGPDDARSLASTVLALLLPELPVVVWTIGEIDMRGDAIARVLEAADAVYVDSADTFDPAKGMRDALAAHVAHHVEVRDLAWRRLGAWRGLIAQFFDGDEGVRRLQTLQSVDITSGGGRPASEALLMAGWLISSLGLSLAALDVHRAEISATLYDASRGVSLRVSTDDKRTAAITEVTLRTPEAEYVVQHHPESGHMHVREERAGDSIHRTVAQAATDDATILGDALNDQSDADVFLDALKSAVSLLGDEAG